MKLAKTQTPTIRRYEPEDQAAVATLHETALRQAGTFAEGHEELDRDLDNIEAVYLDNGGEFLVGVLEDRTVAMGALRRSDEHRAEIKRMRVESASQGRGFGRTMLEALESRARELGYAMLHLDTAVRQRAARRLYETHGYREAGMGLVGPLESVFYEKSLGA